MCAVCEMECSLPIHTSSSTSTYTCTPASISMNIKMCKLFCRKGEKGKKEGEISMNIGSRWLGFYFRIIRGCAVF